MIAEVTEVKVKRAIARMAGMNESAWLIWEKSVQLTLLLLCCGLLLTLSPERSAAGMAGACYEISQSCFLIGNLFAVIFEDQQSRR